MHSYERTFFEYGDGVTASIMKANKHYLEAADRINSIVLRKVVGAFENGSRIKKNIQRVVDYLRLTASSGNMRAQRNSVTYNMKGHRVERLNRYIRKFWKNPLQETAKKPIMGKTEESSRIDQILGSTANPHQFE